MKKMWKQLLAACCATAMLMTMPGVCVLANEIQEENELIVEEAEVPEEPVESVDAPIEGMTESVDMPIKEDALSQETAEEIVGEDPVQVGDGVTAIFDADTGAVEFISQDGELWPDWVEKLGVGRDDIKSIKVASGTVHLPADSRGYDTWKGISYIFGSLYNLTSLDLSNFDTSNVTDMSNMFRDCNSLTDIDLSRFDTSKVTDMDGMFSGCSSLTNLDLSSFDTSKVMYMCHMFYNCDSLTNLDLSNFDTANVKDMYNMFLGCESLTNLDLSNFDTANVKDMNNMFNSCSSLTNLDLSSFNTSNVTHMDRMFRDCSSLTNLDLSSFDTSNVTNMYEMFYDCKSLTNLDLSSFDTSNVTDMSGTFYSCSSLTNLDLSSFDTSNVTDMSSMFEGCSSLTELDLSSFNTLNVTDMCQMFWLCSSLIELDLSSFDTSNVRYMELMFCRCASLTNLDLSSFDTSNVTSMGYMFSGCSNLTNLDLSSFDTSNVTNMYEMFYDCKSLTNLNLSSFDTSRVSDMSGTFYSCSSLTNLDLSNFDTSNMTDMGYMFEGCNSLTNLDLSNFDTSNVTNMSAMFLSCSSLTNLDLSSFNTSNVEYMGNMFSGCKSLTSLNLSNFDTANVKYMYNMFLGCESLTNLDLSSFDTSNVTDMYEMFYDCKSLTNLDLSSFDTSNVTDMSGTFYSCSSLTNLDLSSFDTSNVTDMSSMLYGCYNLQLLLTPKNNSETTGLPIMLYDSIGNSYTSLPLTSKSIVLAKTPQMAQEYEMTEEEHIQAYAIVDGEGAEFYYNTETLNKIDSEKGNTAKGKFTYKDEWFFGDTTKYNHDLAKMSLAAALAAFGADENGSAKNIKALMDKLGFSYDNESIQYPTPNRYTMGYAIGSKPISEDTSLIMVASRGGGYKSEWCSNFLVGKTGDHEGFDEGSVQVGDGLSAYINKHKSELKENVKIWMVGYSRGAAVTNLAAADLDDGFIPGFGKDNVFAYCFECPQGTINKNAHSSNYSNIHNIINKIDLVPQVAMKGWAFQRYGKDYYLPFAESLRGYSSYKAEMKKEYDKILKDNGIDDFTTRTNWVQSLTSEAKGQAITLRDLTDYITYLIDRKTYVDSSLQRDAQALADKYLGDGIQSDEILDKELGVFLTKLNFLTRFPAMADRIDHVRLTVPSPVSNIDDLPTNFMAAHYPELCLAWMNSLDGGLETYNNQYEKIFINCPVDVVIKDDEGNIVTRIIDNKVENIENGLYAYIDDNEQKVVVVPGDGNYTAEIIANDDCDVTYTVKEYSDNDYMPESIKSYQSVEMLKEGSLKADIKPEISEYILQDDNSILIPSIDESSNNIKSYLIQTECDGNGIVEGGGIFTTGEFAKVTAKSSDGSTFEGWYIGSDLISSEKEYRFAVTEDVYLTAKFSDDPSVSKTNIASATISIDEGTFIYTGKRITPVVTVKDSSNNTLIENRDFTITYSNNINAGTATVTVNGKGNYTGTISKSFTIAKSAPKLKFASISLSKKIGDATFTNTLTKTTDGTVTFSSSDTKIAEVNSTSGLVTIKGAGAATITASAAEGTNYKAGSASYTLIVEPPAPGPAVTGFSDVQDSTHPYYKAIYWAAGEGITKGYSDGTFGINRSCTRGEMMMFLWRYAGKPAPKTVSKSPFKDVPKTHTFYKAILWGSQKGITKGYSDGTFGVNRNVSRGECMMFLWRLRGKPAPKAVAKAPFPDVPKSHVFYNAVLWGYQKKITTGFTSGKLKGKFGVNENCSRGQIVTFLYRAK